MIREGVYEDEMLFRILFMEYLEDQYDLGNDIVPDHKSIEFFVKQAWYYSHKILDGIVLFSDENAVLMWGEPVGSPTTNRHGKVAIGWGTYVRKDFRGNGISKEMRNIAKKALFEMGFSYVHGSLLVNCSEASKKSAYNIGLRMNSVSGLIPLGDT